MAPLDYSVSIRIRHKIFTPSEITAELRLNPKHFWAVGSAKASGEGVRHESYWTHEFKHPKDVELAIFLNSVVDKLSIHKMFFEKLVLTQGSIEFFIGCFLNGNQGEIFDWQLLRKIAALRISLSLDIYPGGKS
jgi:hypothetical protein